MFFATAYQSFSRAVALATFLVVEEPVPSAAIRSDIEIAILDLRVLDSKDVSILWASKGRNALMRLVAIHDRKEVASPAETDVILSSISAYRVGNGWLGHM